MKIPMSRMKRIKRCGLGVITLALCGFTAALSKPPLSQAQLFNQAAPRPGPAIGRTATAFNLETLDGTSIKLDSFRGKPLIINFFASWCDPCREEMPLINELASAGATHGFSVLGIAVEDSRAAMTEYRREAKLIFPIALDLNNTVKRAYRIFGPPATFFIDAQGIIRDMVLGPITRERAIEALTSAGVTEKFK
jgi:cytochrome c biogenesis protein CcmG/thiol:disulfide interchange protein DsbE